MAAPVQTADRIESASSETACVMSSDLGWLLAQTSHGLAVEQTARLEDLGIAPRGYCVLRGALSGEFTQSEIGAAIGIDKTTMVVTMDLLEKTGLAERTPSKTDRRARVIAVTAKGRKKVAEAERVTKELHEEVLAELSEDQREILLGSLQKILLGPLADTASCQQPPRRRTPRA